MLGNGAAPVRRQGISGFIAIFSEAVVLLRASAPLRRSLRAWLGLGLLFTVASSLGLAIIHGGGYLPIAVAALAWWAFVSLFMLGGATLLITPDGAHIDYYGIPNGISALRAWTCLPLILVATLSLPGSLGLILWCTVGGPAAMLDFVDGYIARRYGPITELGKALDPAMDSVFFAVAAVGSYRLGIAPLWLMAYMLLRYLGPLLATPVVLLLRRRPELVHTQWGRRNTSLVGALLFILMWVRIFNGPVLAVSLVLGLPTLLPTLVLHFVALWQRARQAPVVS